MTDRLPQLNVEVTPQVKTKLAKLEAELSTQKADKHEIVAVLIQLAKASAIRPAELRRYRTEREKERKKLR